MACHQWVVVSAVDVFESINYERIVCKHTTAIAEDVICLMRYHSIISHELSPFERIPNQPNHHQSRNKQKMKQNETIDDSNDCSNDRKLTMLVSIMSRHLSSADRVLFDLQQSR